MKQVKEIHIMIIYFIKTTNPNPSPTGLGFGLWRFGGDEGDRTPYLLNAIQALSQVSYTPEKTEAFLMLDYIITVFKKNQ